MTVSRPIVVAFSFVVATAGCAKLLPAPHGPSVIAADPRGRKEVARRRDGSDVVLPATADKSWLIGALVPCNPRDSAAAKPNASPECAGVDAKGEVVETNKDTTATKQP